jgi:hypothetical protein
VHHQAIQARNSNKNINHSSIYAVFTCKPSAFISKATQITLQK